MSRNIKVYLQDISESIKIIGKYTAGVTESEFLNNLQLQDAVMRRLEIIGEAVKNIPAQIRRKYSEIPWQEIAGLRDILIHEYFGVDAKRVWKTIKDDLPGLESKIQKLLKREG